MFTSMYFGWPCTGEIGIDGMKCEKSTLNGQRTTN